MSKDLNPSKDSNSYVSKHTPGPWKKVMDEPYDLRIKAGDRGICEVWLDDAPVPDYNEEQQANASLIAAAPDLLTAAKRIEPAVMGQESYFDAIMALQAAIDKAEGRR
jgi:hypothetical protein